MVLGCSKEQEVCECRRMERMKRRWRSDLVASITIDYKPVREPADGMR